MYEQFSSEVESIIKIAQDVARDYDMEYVGTEHILLAIARHNDGLSAKILGNFDVTEGKIKDEIDHFIRQSMEETWVFGRLPGTPHFKNVVIQAIEQARTLGSKEVFPEHLLLAILKAEGSVAFNALGNLGMTYDKVIDDLKP